MCPNWCGGIVEVNGKPKDVEKFCRLFIFEGEEKGDTKKYFARSFTQVDWELFKKNHLGGSSAEFMVDFAWSCHSCLIKGYPDDIQQCVTLEQACKRYNVEVEIHTEEGGCAFEETIIYTKENGLTNDCIEMPTYVCECGEERCFPTNCDYLDEEECYECEKIGKWRFKNA